MTEILLIRHAETDLAGTFCGVSDPPVNARGRDQIAALLHSLADERIDLVYTSDLDRAHTTALALVRRFAVPCIAKPALREIDFGVWEGLTWAQIEASHPAHAKAWLEGYPNLSAPRGERFDAFEARVLDGFDRIVSQSHDNRTALVAHAGVLRTILRHRGNVTELEAWSSTKSYCSVFRYKHCASLHPVGIR
jgi:alpha-ribazole phosphatase